MPARELGFHELFKAVYLRLKANALTSGYNIYNYVPDGTSLPYIRVTPSTGVRSPSFDNRTTAVEQNAFELHTWSGYLGDKEASEMMNNSVKAIESASLSITGYQTPFLALLDFAELIIDNSIKGEPARHGITRYRVDMAPTP